MIQLKSDKEVKKFERMPQGLEDQIKQQKRILNNSPFAPHFNCRCSMPNSPTPQVTEDIEFEDVTHKRLGK